MEVDKIGLVDWLNHCDKQPAKNKENSNTRKKLVGRKFSYFRSRVGTWTTLASKEYYYKVNNSGARYSSKSLNPNAPVFTPRASPAKSVSYPNTSSISSRPPPVAPRRFHSKLNDSNLPHSYNVVTKNRFAALYKIGELEDIRSNSLTQKTKASQYGPGGKAAVKIKKLNMEKTTVSQPLDMVDTISQESTQNSS